MQPLCCIQLLLCLHIIQATPSSQAPAGKPAATFQIAGGLIDYTCKMVWLQVCVVSSCERDYHQHQGRPAIRHASSIAFQVV